MLALVDDHIQKVLVKKYYYYYLEHQKDIPILDRQYELDKAKARAHILEGLNYAVI